MCKQNILFTCTLSSMIFPVIFTFIQLFQMLHITLDEYQYHQCEKLLSYIDAVATNKKAWIFRITQTTLRNIHFAVDSTYWSTISVFQNLRAPFFTHHFNKNY